MANGTLIQANAKAVLGFLRNIQDENKNLARKSADSLESNLHMYLQAKNRQEKELAYSSLSYALGGKGIFDSYWNETNLKTLQLLCSDLEKSLS